LKRASQKLMNWTGAPDELWLAAFQVPGWHQQLHSTSSFGMENSFWEATWGHSWYLWVFGASLLWAPLLLVTSSHVPQVNWESWILAQCC
jgi:hypothetical protein